MDLISNYIIIARCCPGQRFVFLINIFVQHVYTIFLLIIILILYVGNEPFRWKKKSCLGYPLHIYMLYELKNQAVYTPQFSSNNLLN